MMPLKQWKYKQFHAASGPPGPIETLSLALFQGTCDSFQRSIKKPKSLVVDHKGMVGQLCSQKPTDINNFTPTRSPKGGQRPHLHIQKHYKGQLE